MKTNAYLVIDLEATCDDQGAVPRDEMETIEIGAVLVDAKTLEPIAEHQTFIRPVRHPQLTPFCTELTTITQAMLADAPGFPEAIAELGRFLLSCQVPSAPTSPSVGAARHPPAGVGANRTRHGCIEPPRTLFCSWGDYDKRQLQQDAQFHRVALPFRGGHLNLKRAFSQALGKRKGFGMGRALKRVGLPLLGTHHRGIDDARNIARLLPFCLGREPIPAPPQLNRASRRGAVGSAPRRRS